MSVKQKEIFYIFLALVFFITPHVFAQNVTPNDKGYKIKFVFPFGDPKSQSICPLPDRTLDGCCDGPQDHIYEVNNKKGCCRPPQEFFTIGTSSACCAALKPNQNRWGQTFSSVCGGDCPPPSEVRTHQTFNSCCPECAANIGVVAFQNVGNVCGTCCSRVPESCGNAGIRVCSEGTGSAYCSKIPDKCNDADDWLIGSYGEGGYHCCDKCTNGKRYNQTNSGCGSCCTNPNVTITYQGATSCCTSLVDRYMQTAENICGTDCPSDRLVTYDTTSSCCPTACSTFRSYQNIINPCGTCCQSTTLDCGPAGELMCANATGSRYCSPTGCSGEGYAISGTPSTGYSCSYKAPPPTSSCSWFAYTGGGYWQCAACFRDNSYYAKDPCVYEGGQANPTCTARSAVTAYACSASMQSRQTAWNGYSYANYVNWDIYATANDKKTLICSTRYAVYTGPYPPTMTHNCPFNPSYGIGPWDGFAGGCFVSAPYATFHPNCNANCTAQVAKTYSCSTYSGTLW